MEVSFIKLSPTQNVTILVEQDVPREIQPAVAPKQLAYDRVGGEQVGFLERPTLPGADARLQMMGGEFCGNASMSLGAVLAWRGGLREGAAADYALEVSGAEGLIRCHIEREGDACRGTVCMPLPRRLGEAAVETDAGRMTLPMVDMNGITHLIAEARTGLSREEIERRIRGWNGEVRADALGVLRIDAAGNAMEPIVYVPSTDTAVWERGCGSGTAALGCWRAWARKRSFRAPIRQPGGEITVSAEWESGGIAELTIAGTVRVTASGKAYL